MNAKQSITYPDMKKPPKTIKYRVISMGAGVQSSTLGFMAAKGLLGHIDFAVMADTQGEPQKVYQWLSWMKKQLPFPIYQPSKGNLAADTIRVRRSRKSGNRYLANKIPAFVKKKDGTKGILMRQCTRDYKIMVVYREIVRILKLNIKERREVIVEIILGISTDEADRVAEPYKKWVFNRYPLLELGMSREDCKRWMKRHHLPEPPRSACVYCPYHSDAEWLRLKREAPKDFQSAVDLERRLQQAAKRSDIFDGKPFLHVDLVPLDRVKFSNKDPAVEFHSECEGMCGL